MKRKFLVGPTEGFGDLLGEGKGIEGFEEYCRDAEVGEAALVNALNFCGEEQNGDVDNDGMLLHFAECGGPVDLRHHDVHEDGVGSFESSDGHAFGSGAGSEDFPAGSGFERKSRDFADIVLVINN